MPRNQNALAIVNAGFLIVKDPKTNIISDAKIVYGNIAANFVHAKETEKYLIGKNVSNNETLQQALKLLNKEVVPVENPPNPSKECRKKLGVCLFYEVCYFLAFRYPLPTYMSWIKFNIFIHLLPFPVHFKHHPC